MRADLERELRELAVELARLRLVEREAVALVRVLEADNGSVFESSIDACLEACAPHVALINHLTSPGWEPPK